MIKNKFKVTIHNKIAKTKVFAICNSVNHLMNHSCQLKNFEDWIYNDKTLFLLLLLLDIAYCYLAKSSAKLT